MKTVKILVILAFAPIVSSICFAQDANAPTTVDKVDLKIRMTAGDSHEMKAIQKQDVSQTVNGQEMKTIQEMEWLFGLDCKSVDANGIMLVEMTYKAVKMEMENAMAKMEFDSDNPKPADPNKPQEKMMADIFSAIVGCKFSMKVSPTGETSEFGGIKEMLAKMKEKMGDSNEAKAIDAMLNQMFDEKEIKTTSSNLMLIFPKEPVAIGDVWYDTISMNMMVPIDIETTYIFKSRKDGIAYIDAIAKFDMGDSAKPLEMDTVKMSMQMAGTMNSANQVDEKTGLLKKCEMTTNLSGIMKMEANEQMPQGMTMPMTITGTSTVELVK